MADITTPNTFAAGTPLDPAPVAENTFGPESLPQNMAALNGRLNRSNLVAPATVTRDMVRSGSFLTGRTDGVTTKDYNANVWHPDHRWWSGHLVLDTTNSTDFIPVGNKQPYAKGWHTIEIRVAHPHKHLRIKTRRMTAIPFR